MVQYSIAALNIVKMKTLLASSLFLAWLLLLSSLAGQIYVFCYSVMKIVAFKLHCSDI